jgi:YbbR domain-containing protein
MGNPSQGLAAMTPMIAPNDVVIMGAESKVNKIKSVRVDVDIASVNAQVKKILPVRVLDENGKDVQNITIEPSNVEVSIPIENTKRVNLQMNLAGQPAAGYMINNISVQPEGILITGNQQILESINAIETEKIDITDVTSDVSKTVKLMLPEGVELVNANEKVNIFVNIEKITTSEITINSFDYVNLPEGLEVESMQSGIKVSLRGAESQLVDAANTIKFFVDLKHATEGTNMLNIFWEAPQGIEVVNVSPQQAVVVLRKKNA